MQWLAASGDVISPMHAPVGYLGRDIYFVPNSYFNAFNTSQCPDMRDLLQIEIEKILALFSQCLTFRGVEVWA